MHTERIIEKKRRTNHPRRKCDNRSNKALVGERIAFDKFRRRQAAERRKEIALNRLRHLMRRYVGAQQGFFGVVRRNQLSVQLRRLGLKPITKNRHRGSHVAHQLVSPVMELTGRTCISHARSWPHGCTPAAMFEDCGSKLNQQAKCHDRGDCKNNSCFHSSASRECETMCWLNIDRKSTRL